MNTDRLLSIFELILKKDERDVRPVLASAQPIESYTDSATHAALSGDSDDVFGSGENSAEKRIVNALADQTPYFAQFPDAMATLKPEKVISPDLGGEIPKQWLDSIDAIVDFVKDNPEALSGIDAMMMEWLKIKRYEPKHGDPIDRKCETLNGEIGFVIDSCLKRGYEYNGKSSQPSSYTGGYRAGYYPGSMVRRAVVKLVNGIVPADTVAQKI